MEESAHLLLGASDHSVARTASNAVDWINSCAKFNVVRNKAYQDHKQSRETQKGLAFLRGNSRDEPTYFKFTCTRTPGCTYQSDSPLVVSRHMAVCNTATVASKAASAKNDILTCTYAGCKYQTRNKSTMSTHVRSVHKWTPRTCDKCPEGNTKLYMTGSAYRTHLGRAHSNSNEWPAKCTFPLCPDTKTFPRRELMLHLFNRHNLTTDVERAPYTPGAIASQQKWVEQKCVVSSCDHKTLYKRRYRMRDHLINAHKMSEGEAEKLIDRNGLTQSRATAGVDNNKRKFSDTDKENIAPVPTDGVHSINHVADKGTEKAKKEKVKKKKN